MSLADALAANTPRVGPPSRIPQLLDELEGDDRDTFEVALRDPKVSAGQLSAALRSMGHTCDQQTIRSWRRQNGVS